MNDRTNDGEAACGGCTLRDALDVPAAVERRDFLRISGLVLASLGLFGGAARPAAAMMPRMVSALPRQMADRTEEKRYAISATDDVMIDRDNSVIIARAAGRVYAFSLACPHQNTALRWSAEEHQFQCPKHKSHYRPDGTFIEGRATRDMDRMMIRREGNVVVVDIDKLLQQDENQHEWTAAFVAV